MPFPVWLRIAQSPRIAVDPLTYDDGAAFQDLWNTYGKKPKQHDPKALEQHVQKSTANLSRIYELEYKTSMLSREQKKGPLPERANLELMKGLDELGRAVDRELQLLTEAYEDWIDEAETKYKGQNDARIMKRIYDIYNRLVNYKSVEGLGMRIALMHEALTQAHHNASMATYAYGLGRDNTGMMEYQIQQKLDDLSADPPEEWTQHVQNLNQMPRGAGTYARKKSR